VTSTFSIFFVKLAEAGQFSFMSMLIVARGMIFRSNKMQNFLGGVVEDEEQSEDDNICHPGSPGNDRSGPRT
jgi:hypothetical protein